MMRPMAAYQRDRGQREAVDPGFYVRQLDAIGAFGSGRAMTVAGRPATLYTAGGGVVQLELTLGRTFVTIHGADRTQVLRAVEALQKLN
jgi:hypothetical protein